MTPGERAGAGADLHAGDGHWAGRAAHEWAHRTGAPLVEIHDVLPSTNDRVHALAATGAPHGAVVLARQQAAGRGRHGRTWASARDAGVWCSVLVRSPDADAMGVLALRVGLALARRLAPLVGPAGAPPVRLKWPNDVFVGEAKVAGVLIEARWQDGVPAYAVVGVGVNLDVPDGVPSGVAATGLGRAHAADAFAGVVSAVQEAAQATGRLTDAELAEWDTRDLARGRSLSSPGHGIALGLTADGGLQVRQAGGIATFHAGSLVFA